MSRNDEFASGAKRYFHASFADLPDGSTLVPGAQLGKANFKTPEKGGTADNRHVYMTTAAHHALSWIKSRARGRRIYVYEVEPHEDVHVHEGSQYRASSAVIRRRLQ